MALARHASGTSGPPSVEELITEAQNFTFHANRPLQQWLRAAKMLLTEAVICEQDGNLQRAFVYAYRHADLILAKLPGHHDYKNPKFKGDLSQARGSVKANFPKLESWRPKIIREHQRYAKMTEKRIAELQTSRNEGLGDDNGNGGTGEATLRALHAGEESRLAVNLAQREMRRRDESKRETRRAGIDDRVVTARRQGIVVDELRGDRDGVREAGRLLGANHQDMPVRGTREISRVVESSVYRYPAVPQQGTAVDWMLRSRDLPPTGSRGAVSPLIPAKELIGRSENDASPARPPKVAPSPPPRRSSAGPAIEKYVFTTHATTEAGTPLRTLLLPPALRRTFLDLASVNTSRNLETCGILAATPHAGALFITHLIVPGQTSTSDTCDTTEAGECALFEYCDGHDLLVCGWIHTHPSQTCFLSSRDLHTSSGYQVMLPEAIAIVCSPSHEPSWAVFRLTEPPGLSHILDCTKPGIFHPHAETRLYTDALSGEGVKSTGHVVEGPGLEFEVVDLR